MYFHIQYVTPCARQVINSFLTNNVNKKDNSVKAKGKVLSVIIVKLEAWLCPLPAFGIRQSCPFGKPALINSLG